MRRAYIAYNRRSSTTGRQLFEHFKSNSLAGKSWRHTTNTPRTTDNVDVFVRWGNSYTPVIEGAVELNTQEAVACATDKAVMMRRLQATEGVSTPIVYYPPVSLSHNMFVRDRNDHVCVKGHLSSSDKYAMEPIEKVREFRIHIFNDKTLGVYEKVPHDGMDTFSILKDHNSRFQRLDMALNTNKNDLRGARPMAKAAVKGLGLLFGGVDIVKDNNNNWFVLEVNSSPALNTENIVRWGNAINEYIESPSNTTEEYTEEDARALREAHIKERIRRSCENSFSSFPSNFIKYKVNVITNSIIDGFIGTYNFDTTEDLDGSINSYVSSLYDTLISQLSMYMLNTTTSAIESEWEIVFDEDRNTLSFTPREEAFEIEV
jgi:hypothetical protein